MNENQLWNPPAAALSAQYSRIPSKFGLTLSESQCRALDKSRRRALSETGRVELGGGILPRLAETFCDSPYVMPETWAETLEVLQAAFYRFKTESRDQLADGEVLALMRRLYDSRAGGDAGFVAEAELETLLSREEDTDAR